MKAKLKNGKEKETNPIEEEKIIVDLAKQGLTAEKIGLILKEKYNIRPKAKGIVIGKILRKHNLYQNPDIKNLSIRANKIKKHLSKNKHDHKTKRTLLIKEVKLKKLNKYMGKER